VTKPDEGVSVSIGAKIPGPRMRIRPVLMQFQYGTSFLSESPEAYERLILDAMRGDATLFTRNEEIEALWGSSTRSSPPGMRTPPRRSRSTRQARPDPPRRGLCSIAGGGGGGSEQHGAGAVARAGAPAPAASGAADAGAVVRRAQPAGVLRDRLPAMVPFVEWRYLRTGDELYLTLARSWSRVLVALFAVGVITGTILSFEMRLLWPNFMATFGSVFGLGFAIEGFSFFVEAIFIGIYVYGWGRLPPRAHFLSGIPVAIAGFTGSPMEGEAGLRIVPRYRRSRPASGQRLPHASFSGPLVEAEASAIAMIPRTATRRPRGSGRASTPRDREPQKRPVRRAARRPQDVVAGRRPILDEEPEQPLVGARQPSGQHDSEGSPSRSEHKPACPARRSAYPPSKMARHSPYQVIVLGPPGAGKGTQAERLAECLGVVHISPGEILRREIPPDSVTGQQIRAIMATGELVPDELIDGVVRRRLEALAPEQGFVLDGYPRTAAEAQSLRALLARLGRLEPRPAVVWLEIPREELVRRLRRRRELDGRADDAEEALARRLAIHDAHAGAVRDALGSWTDVAVIDGSPPVDAVTAEILERLYLIQSERARRAVCSLETSKVSH
jgi:adenylate kinase family enzyme